jgi:DNA-binding LacI/PurR family transcriptional regulator
VATGAHSRGGPATDTLLELAATGLPISLVLDRSPGHGIPALDVDHLRGGYLAAHHLLSLGHRRVAHFTFDDVPLEPGTPGSHMARFQGYCRALEDASIERDPAWLILGPREIEGGRRMAYDFLERFPNQATRPTAIVAFNDRTAIGVLRGFYEAGLRVPEDVALIGFHDIPTARYTTPALTTIGHPLIELGEMAADSLFTLLAGGEIEQLDRTIPVSLVIRESCGAQPRPTPRTGTRLSIVPSTSDSAMPLVPTGSITVSSDRAAPGLPPSVPTPAPPSVRGDAHA